jgi:hypothetical protein
MVTVAEGDPGFTLNVTLDLSDERNAVLDLRASLHYLETDLLDEWGIQVVQFSELADVPLLTADGLRLAHHNGLVDLNLFTDAFPVDDIITGVTDGIPGIDLTMSEFTWVADTVAEGVTGPSGGLNYTHGEGCTETGVTGVHQHYCLTGAAAMGYDHPVVLRTVSEPVNLRFLDLLAANIDDPTVDDFLSTVQDDDLRRMMEAGFAASLNPPDDLLNSIVPEQLGGTDLQVTVVLPNWEVQARGSGITKSRTTTARCSAQPPNERASSAAWNWTSKRSTSMSGDRLFPSNSVLRCVWTCTGWPSSKTSPARTTLCTCNSRSFQRTCSGWPWTCRAAWTTRWPWKSPSPFRAMISIGTTRSAINPFRSKPQKKASPRS